MSCGSSPNLLRANVNQRSLKLEYPGFRRLLFEKQSVSRKEKWNKLNLQCNSSRGKWRNKR